MTPQASHSGGTYLRAAACVPPPLKITLDSCRSKQSSVRGNGKCMGLMNVCLGVAYSLRAPSALVQVHVATAGWLAAPQAPCLHHSAPAINIKYLATYHDRGACLIGGKRKAKDCCISLQGEETCACLVELRVRHALGHHVVHRQLREHKQKRTAEGQLGTHMAARRTSS